MEFTGERLIPDQQRNDDLYHEHIVRYRFASQFARGCSVLDAGCGTGYGASLLAAAGAVSVLGVDVAADAIDYARQRYQADNLAFAGQDVCHLDLPSASFDLVVSFEVIEHLDEPALLVQAAQRVLAAGGLFVVSTPNPVTYPAGNPFHKHELDVGAFSALLRTSFPAVALFEQDYSTALAVRRGADPDSETRRPGIMPGTAQSWMFTPAPDRATQEPDYYIAVCAHQAQTLDRALQSAHSVMEELPNDRLGERIRDLLALQRILDEKNGALAQKDVHIARLEDELRKQGAWASDLQEQILALRKAWYVRLFGRRRR